MENDPKDDHAHGDYSYAPRHSAQSVILSTLAVMLISLLQVLQRSPWLKRRSQPGEATGRAQQDERPLKQADDWINR
jgi:hypothetical protein